MTTFSTMDEFIRPRSVGRAGALAEAPAEKLAFLRKVYALFTGSLVTACVGAVLALYAGTDASQVTIPLGNQLLRVPPLVFFFVNHWFIGIALFLGSFFG